jgi:hypothetical protein
MRRFGFSGGITPVSAFTLYASGGPGLTEEITIPSPEAGAFCLIFNAANNIAPGNPTDVTPSGFTQLATLASNRLRCSVFAKKLVGNETTVNGLSSDDNMGWLVRCFRPTGRFFSFANGQTPDSEETSGNPPPQSIVASGATAPVIKWGMAAGIGSSTSSLNFSPTGMTFGAQSSERAVNWWLTFNGAHEADNVPDTPEDRTVDCNDMGLVSMIIAGFTTFE